ncbi:hypothetical protein [Jannaschia seohaensis]|uniref:Uncharacterized protein n=1 Tax=Jannaschia seohaensis TaxID=475081 RepID=A0A2Y9B2D4_9RHOB|nr:hypothetical protein [Jannaschia seohaensis]PWJ13285.1 hypothetical protein BCF38_11448 [Jannaschia seohaensis]SSA50611.1 hypothetical protein SAMN05421539_11448 [Jannaschia seohaensis]
MVKLRNPLIAREGPPVALNVRAARWGALACVAAVAVMAGPILRGHGDAEAWLAARPEACGTRPEARVAPPDASDLRAASALWFIETCEVAE